MRAVVYWLKVFTSAAALHYLLAPSESGSPTQALIIRSFSGLILVIMLTSGLRTNKSLLALLPPATLVVLFFGLPSLLRDLTPAIVLAFFVAVGCIISACAWVPNRDPMLSKAVDCVLLFWLGSLLLQLALFWATGEAIDLHAHVHPMSEARITTAGTFIRLTGVMIEPGTYSAWIYGLVLVRGALFQKAYDWLSATAILSTVLTLSAWGAVAAAAYFVAFTLTSRSTGGPTSRTKAAWLAIFLTATIIIYLYMAGDSDAPWLYLLERYELLDGSGAAKVAAYEGFRHVIGAILVAGLPFSYDFCGGCLSPQDAGLAVNMAVRAGIIATALIFAIIFFGFFRLYGAAGQILVAPLLIAKFFYYEPIFWILFGYTFLVCARTLQPSILRHSRTASRRLN